MSNEGRCKTGNFKAVLAVLIVIFVTLSGSFKASAINKQIFITVKVNGNYIKMDTWPYIKDGRTLYQYALSLKLSEQKWNGMAKTRKLQ